MGRKTNIKDRILKDMEKNVNYAIVNAANEISFQIESAFENAISLFYSNYDPIVYNRTYSTFLASSGYEDPFSSENVYLSGNLWFAGITVGDPNIPGDPYRASKDWVFDRTFNKGIHGINIKTVRHRNSTLFNKDRQKRILAAYFSKLNKNQQKIKVHTKGIIPLRQTLGTITVQNTSIPKNMVPPPRKLLDREFKKITKRQNLDKIFNDQLKNIITK